MSQTGFLLFVLLAAFGVYVTQKGELGTYAGFFFASGNDPVAPGSSQQSAGNSGVSAGIAQAATLAAAGG